MADVQVAAPSAAPEIAAPEISVPERNTPAYTEWRNTGKLPTSEPKKEEAATSDTKEKTSDSEHAAEPEAAQSQEPNRRRKPGAEERIGQLTAEIKQLREELAKKSDAKAAEPSPAKPEPKEQPKAELKEPDEPTEPNENDFSDWEKYQAAVKEYKAKFREYQKQLREYDRQVAIRDFQAQQQQKAEQEKLQSQLDNARKVYGEEADKVIFPTTNRIFGDQKIPVLFKAVINDSDVAVDLLYVLGSKPQDFDSLVQKMTSNDARQMRAAMKEIFLIEKLIEEERGGKAKASEPEKTAPERDASGKFVKAAEEKVPEKKVSSAPPPSDEVRGGSVPTPEDDRAAQAGDFRAFRNARNREDAARLKGI